MATAPYMTPRPGVPVRAAPTAKTQAYTATTPATQLTQESTPPGMVSRP